MIGAILSKKVVRYAFNALSQHNLDDFMAYWTEDARLIHLVPVGPGFDEPLHVIEGSEAIREWYQRFIDKWQVTSFAIKNICVKSRCPLAFGANMVMMEYDLKVNRIGAQECDTSGVAAINIRHNRFTEVRNYECLKEPVWRTLAP